MGPVFIAVMVGVAVYIAVIALLPKSIIADTRRYTRQMIDKLAKEKTLDDDEDVAISVLRAQTKSVNSLSRIFFLFPGANAAYPLLLSAGLAKSISGFFIACIVVFFIALFMLRGFGIGGLIGAVGSAYLFGFWYIRRRINKRNNAFLNYFPDALDMIVRSVRSGYPLNSAVRMVADNIQPPVSTEFKQVADEVAYGSTLIEALQRLSYRIDEPDVRFFVVVLTVQQDVGGNLSEVLSNLSGIIRKRKYLRMKIRALASEGRTTAWVLGSMPFCEAGLILLVSPNHLDPLFNTALGHLVLMATLGIVTLGILIVRQMVNIKV